MNRTNGFLKGPATDTESIRSLVEAVERGESHQVCVVNYNKEGQPFYNTISCHPLRDSNGVLTHYCGVLQGERVPEGEIPPITRDPLPLRESDLDALQICDPGCSGVVKHEVDAPAALHRPKRRRNDLTLSEALNNQHDAVVLTDSNPPYAITHVNQRWSEMCGYTLEVRKLPLCSCMCVPIVVSCGHRTSSSVPCFPPLYAGGGGSHKQNPAGA